MPRKSERAPRVPKKASKRMSKRVSKAKPKKSAESESGIAPEAETALEAGAASEIETEAETVIGAAIGDDEVMQAARKAAAAVASRAAPGEAAGEITIDPGIVSEIATREALAIEGVAGLAGGSFLGLGGHGKAVTIEIEGESAVIALRIVAIYGRNVRTVAERVRRVVYDAVTRMTGFTITRVDVRVCALRSKGGADEADALRPDAEAAGGRAAPIEF